MAEIPSGFGVSSIVKTGGSETQTVTQGKSIKLENGMDKTYLCAHICAAKKSPKKNILGHNLYQRTITDAIRAEAEANFGVWAYLAEVGYDMTVDPPKPLMSHNDERKHRPSTFPLGAAQKQIEIMAKGAFRIPDLTILKIKAQEIIAMRESGTIDWGRLRPEVYNIEKLVEVKVGKDDWFPGQFEAYNVIKKGNVFELTDSDCACDTRKPAKDRVKIPVYPPIKNPTPYKDATFRPASSMLIPRKGIPSMFGWGHAIAPPSQEVIFYRQRVPLKEYQNLMIPITASAGIAGAFICGTVLIGSVGVGVGAEAAGGLLITGFATLAHS